MVLLSFLISSSIIAEDTKVSNDNTKFNIYSGMFDFSDNGKRSALIGFQHQNTDLNRNTFLEKYFCLNQYSDVETQLKQISFHYH